MRSLVIFSFVALMWSPLAMAQADPVAAAGAFLRAMLAGDVEAIRALRTEDAMFAGADVSVPLSGSEDALAKKAPWKECTAGPLRLKPDKVPPDTLGLASLRAGTAKMVEGAVTCLTKAGQIRTSPITIIVVDGKVAVFASDQ